MHVGELSMSKLIYLRPRRDFTKSDANFTLKIWLGVWGDIRRVLVKTCI